MSNKKLLIVCCCTVALTASAHSWFGSIQSISADLNKMTPQTINQTDDRDATVLMAAASTGHPDLVIAAINKGADINAMDRNGWTAVHHLVYSAPNNQNTINALNALLEAKPDLRLMGNGGSVLHAALRSRQIKEKAIILLIDKGADVNAADQQGITPFMLINSINAYPAKAIGAMMKAKVNVNAQDKLGRTALIHCILRHGQRTWQLPASMVHIPGIDLNLADRDGNTPLHYATSSVDDSPKRTALVKMFLDKGADVNRLNKAGQSILMRTLENNQPQLTVLLVTKYKADVNLAAHDQDERPLHVAIREGRQDLAKLFLDKGANINQVYSLMGEQMTPLKLALSKPAMLKFVLKQKPDLNARFGNQLTALHYAADHFSDGIAVRQLIKAGANVQAQDGDKNTALHYAIRNLNPAAAKVLLAAGAQVDAQNARGQSPLFLAVSRNDLSLCRLLLSHNANPDLKDTDGKSPKDYASIRLKQSLKW